MQFVEITSSGGNAGAEKSLLILKMETGTASALQENAEFYDSC